MIIWDTYYDDDDIFIPGADDEWLNYEPPTGSERERLIDKYRIGRTFMGIRNEVPKPKPKPKPEQEPKPRSNDNADIPDSDMDHPDPVPGRVR